MPLDDLNKELYKQSPDELATHTHEQNLYDPNYSREVESPFEVEEKWDKAQNRLTEKQIKLIKILSGLFGSIALIVGGYFFFGWWQKNSFFEDRVSLVFEGPKEAASMDLVKYNIRYKNNNRATLKNSEILLTYSENFQPVDNVNLRYASPISGKISIGDIPSGSEGTVEVKGVFYAPKDEPVYLNAEMSFTPSFGNTTGQVKIKNQLGVKIKSAPVVLEVQFPRQASDGDRVEYVLDYKNLSISTMKDVQVQVQFSKDFEMLSSQPASLAGNSYWNIGNLESNQSGKIHIQGIIHGIENQNQPLRVKIGILNDEGSLVVYGNREVGTQIVAPILAIKQEIEKQTDGVISAGDILRINILYKNNGEVGLRDSIVTVKLTGKVLDFPNINLAGGAFDDKTKTITWKASSVPGLKSIDPGLSGKISFTIPVKSMIPIDSNEDKNFIVTSLATIDSPDIPTTIEANKRVGSNELSLKLASKILGKTEAFYNDNDLKNTGPIPLNVGKETTFTVKWSLGSVSNDVSDVKVISSLPAGVRWLGTVYPNNEKITYEERTNKLTWDAGAIFAGAGVKNPAREIKFQVGITPQPNQVARKILILDSATVTGRDLFVEKDVTFVIPEKNSELREDPSVGFLGGQVKE